MDCRSFPVGSSQSEHEPFHAPALPSGSNEEVSQMHPDSPVANVLHITKCQGNTTISETVTIFARSKFAMVVHSRNGFSSSMDKCIHTIRNPT